MQLVAFNTVCSLRVFSEGTAVHRSSVACRVSHVLLQLKEQDLILILGNLLAGS